MVQFLKQRLPFVVLLVGCLSAYVVFRLNRSGLPSGWLRTSFPSLLVPLAMFAVVELTPGVGFHRRRIKLLVLTATFLVAVLWLEGVVPRITGRAFGDWHDVAAMGVGFCLFCLYEAMFGRLD